MAKPNAVRGYGPFDNIIARLRHGIAYRKLQAYQPIGRCLDIGSGAYPAFLIGLEAAEKSGLEQTVSPEAKEVCSEHSIGTAEHDLTTSDPIPFEDNHFDAITMLAVIEHFEPSKVPLILRKIHRILKPGGVFMVTTPAAWTDRLLRTLAYLRLVSREEIADHKDVFTQNKLHSRLSDAGFTGIQTGTFECSMNLWATARKE